MNKQFGRVTVDLPRVLVGIGVWLTVLIVYTLTKAPTLSFWDCGEFIAVSHILGIPHPPGTPLYVLLGRIFALLPLSGDPAVRVNFLSVVSSSFTALFGYLAATQILQKWFGEQRSLWTRFLTYAGGATGAFMVAFSLTNWNNAVEAEVYGLTMMLMTLVLWLIVLYAEKRERLSASRIMFLIVYLCFLGIGVHMTTFLMIPVTALFFILKKDAPRRDWYALGIFIFAELYLIFALSSRPGEIPMYIPVFIVFVFYLFYFLSFKQIPVGALLVGAGFALASSPVLLPAMEAWKKGSPGAASIELASFLGAVSTVAFVVLVLFALFSLSRYVSADRKENAAHYLAYALFVFSAVMMWLMLYLPKGYTMFLAVSAFLALLLLILLRRSIDWSILIAIVGITTVVIGVKPFFYGLLGTAVVILAGGALGRLKNWKAAFMIVLCAVAGFSVHLFLPIRSAKQPAINENNPSSSFTAMVNFLERKQYGSQSMVERMFKRRAQWENQFGNYRRMGFWHFFNQQYGLDGRRFVVLFLLGLFGIWEIIRRRTDLGVALTVLLFLCSVGLILYMNFADGTRQHPVTGADYLEVRDRDYFFTPAFVFFGLAIGMGVTVIVQNLKEAVASFSKVPKQIIMVSSLVLFLLPVFPLAQNYYYCDRSRNYIPYDYAWNLLVSCEQNAVLFTYGDNDTFPLWCLQEAYGLRKDVKVVNLSLSNGTWYIKQIQSILHVDLGLSDSQIDKLRPYRLPTGAFFRLQDQVVDLVIDRNYGRRPICFAVSIGAGSRKYKGQSIDSLLILKGMVWQIDTVAGTPLRVDVEYSYDFYMNPEKFRCRGVNDPTIFKDETTTRLTRNWANGFLTVADTLRKAGDYERAERLVSRAVELIPYSPRAVEYLANLYSIEGKIEELRKLVRESRYGDKRQMKLVLARDEKRLYNYEEAERLLLSILDEDESYRPAFDELVRLYYQNKKILSIQMLLKRWVTHNPHDTQAREMLDELQKEIRKSLEREKESGS